MEEAFAEFYGPGEGQIAQLWETAVVTFDTSSLLNLYAFSPPTRAQVLGAMRRLKENDRLWMSYRVGIEFHQGRVKAAMRIASNLNEPRQKIEEVKKSLQGKEGKAKHLEIAGMVVSELDAINARIMRAIDTHLVSGKKHLTIEEDTLLQSLREIFDDRQMIGSPYHKKRFRKIFNDGKWRYALEIPPGFMDEWKNEDAKFGDLIIWHQIMDLAKDRGVPVILVTDDQKDDWTMDSDGHGKRITHPILRSEFKQRTGQGFWLYTTTEFLNAAGKYIQAEVSEEAIKETEEVRESAADADRISTPTLLPPAAYLDQLRQNRGGGLEALEAIGIRRLFDELERNQRMMYEPISTLDLLRAWPELKEEAPDTTEEASSAEPSGGEDQTDEPHSVSDIS